MKKNLFYLFALICSMSLFTACSDDDEAPDYSKVIESEMAGNYKGTLTVTVEGTTMPSEPQKIKIEKAGPSAINLSLANFSFMGITIGDVELKNCVLSQNGNVYTFTGTQDLKVDALSCTINAKGTIANSAVKVDMDIDATVGGLKQSVKVVYEGTRLTGSESSEAKITAFSFDMSNEANAIVIEQPVINEDNTITFRVNEAKVKENPDALNSLVPTFTISEKATSSVESGKAMKLSSDVTIAVTAEDGTIVKYVVKAPTKNDLVKFNFDKWLSLGEELIYEVPLPNDTLASSIEGAVFLSVFGIEGFPVYKSVDDKVAGDAAIKLVTMDTSTKTSRLVPALTAGSVFTGKFNLQHAMTDRMKCTEFGISYDKKPLFFKGWYKYAAGETFINGEGAKSPEDVSIEPGKVDECSIVAVLYETEDDGNGNNKPLTGHDINNSPRRVAVAALSDGTNKSEWTPFNLEFKYLEGKTYEKGKSYQLAIVCSSSKEGDRFKGAGGSTLMLDELEVIGE